MGMVKSLLSRGKTLANSPAVVRVVSNDRVMKMATGVIEARQRLDEASGLWREGLRVLMAGQELPNIDPALDSDEHLGAVSVESATNGSVASRHPTNGHAVNGV
ncbi:MAG: hypothetical protein AAGA56_29380, partial [Myxococcota bacterium]